MKGFLIFIGLMAVIAMVWLAVPFLREREEDFEARLIGALELVEATIMTTATDVLRVDLYSPAVASGNGQQWVVNGVAAMQDSGGETTHLPYSARLEATCADFTRRQCWRMEAMKIGDTAVVVAGQPTGEPYGGSGPSAVPEGGVPAPAGMASPSTRVPELPRAAQPAPVPPRDAGATAEASANAPASPAAGATQPAAGSPATAPAAKPAPASGSDPTARQVAELPAASGAPVQDSAAAAEAEPNLILGIQTRLREAGYDPGPIDGKLGPRTTAAIRAYQERFGLEPDGRATRELLVHIGTALRARGDTAEKSTSTQ